MFAKTCEVLGTLGLIVYRSVECRDTDPLYAPVADLLCRSRLQVVREARVEDEKMMFGEAQWRFFMESPAPSGGQEDFDPKFIEAMSDEALSQIKALTGAA